MNRKRYSSAGRRRHELALRGSVLLLLACASVFPAFSQELAIESTTIVDGRLSLSFEGTAGTYHRLFKGSTVTAIQTPVAIQLSGLGINSVADPALYNAASQAFYRLQQVPVSQPLDTDGDGIDDAYELIQPQSLNALDPTDAALDPDGNGLTHLQEYLLTRDLTTIEEMSPANGESGVSVTRETVLQFSAPLAEDAVINTTNFFAGYGGRKLLSRVEVSQDRRRATLFYLEPMPGSTRIYGVFDGTGLLDATGRPLDPDGDGAPGGMAQFSFDTFSTTPVSGTAVIGRVFASELGSSPGGTNGVNIPLQNVTITVDGAEETIRTTTDAEGRFVLTNTPSGRFFVHVDGRTAVGSNWPDGSYYPTVGKAWEAVAGRTDNLAGGNGEIYLPFIVSGTLQAVSTVAETTITFPEAVVTEHPGLEGVELIVPPNALLREDGTRGGKVGMAPVPADRLPEPLPPGLNLPLVITVQTDGPLNFDQPAPVRFPNLPDPVTGVKLQPGEKSALWSFNHDSGVWEIVGPMTVTADGNFVVTDPGVGIRQPGWHGSQPGVGAGGGPMNGPPCPPGAGKNCHQNPDFTPDDPANYNGCGPDGWDYAVPDNPNFPYSCATFFDACRSHDIGYNTCGQPQRQTDDQFLQDMLAACDCIGNAVDRGACIVTAYAYHAAVTSGGEDAYNAAQEKACICEEPPGCPPSGGPIPAPPGTLNAQSLPGLQNVPQTGRHSFAVVDMTTEEVVLRGKTGTSGIAFTQLILQPNRTYNIAILQETTLWEGFITITTGPSGSRMQLPAFVIRPPVSWNFDGDELHDLGELIMGTDNQSADSDGDGIDDATEVKLGLNPLGEAQVTTGIIASSQTPGKAVDISALNNLAVVADSSAGVAIFDIRGLNPLLTAQVDTPGQALAVSIAGSLVAVADGSAGLAVVDLSDPVNARIVHQIPLSSSARAVTTAGPMAYVGLASGELAVIDLITGTVLQRISVGAAIQDVALIGDALYALTIGRIYALSLDGDEVAIEGSEAVPGGAGAGGRRLRLSAGLNRAYATYTSGFNVLNLADPFDPIHVFQNSTAQFGWKQIVPNGSGLALAAVSPNSTDDGPHHISLYNLEPEGATAEFMTTFETPGLAAAVSVYNGLAYVADSDAGLQVINYLAFDTHQIPPTITLAASFPLDPAQAEEGKTVRLTAEVSDDVQVRNVEFYLDGILVALDGNYPFEHRFVTPQRSETQTTFTVVARATDTGGNFAWSEEFTVTLVPDATPPRVKRTFPNSGAIVGSVQNAAAYFNEPIDPATLSANLVQIVAAGEDRLFGTEDDSVVSGGALTHQADANAAILTFDTELAPGPYQLRISPPIADLAGNPLAQVTVAHFWVIGGQDSDQDGIPDDIESVMGLDPLNPDSNGNGVLDGQEDADGDSLSNAGELFWGFNPLLKDSDENGVEDADEDTDNDWLSVRAELMLGTDPLRADTDGDGWNDEAEATAGSDPLHGGSTPFISVAASPRVEIIAPRAVFGPNLGLGPALATPTVEIIAPREVFISGLGLGPTLARPPLEVILPMEMFDSTVGLGSVYAQPGVTVIVPREILDSSAGLGSVLAAPPLELIVPQAIPPESDSAPVLAAPPVSIEFETN